MREIFVDELAATMTTDTIDVPTVESNDDAIEHPSHYNIGNIEVIDAIEDWNFGFGFNRGNAIKYIVRAGRKNKDTEIKDLKKALWYINREIERLEKSNERNV